MCLLFRGPYLKKQIWMTASILLTHVCCQEDTTFPNKAQTMFILPLLVSRFKNIFNNWHMWHKGERKLRLKIYILLYYQKLLKLISLNLVIKEVLHSCIVMYHIYANNFTLILLTDESWEGRNTWLWIYAPNLFIEHSGEHWWEHNIFCSFTTLQAFWWHQLFSTR